MIRLRELRSEKGLSLRELADELHLSYSSIGKYERNEAQPSFEILFKIADFFDVTTDYLIGYSDIRTKDMEYKDIAEKTGLSVRAIDNLINYYKCSKEKPSSANCADICACYIRTLNIMLGSSCELLSHIADYLYFSATHFKNFYDEDKNALMPISELELWDDVEKISYSDDWDLWSKALLLIVEQDLLYLRDNIQKDKLQKYYESDTPNCNL